MTLCMSGDIITSMGDVGVHLKDFEISILILVVFTPLDTKEYISIHVYS